MCRLDILISWSYLLQKLTALFPAGKLSASQREEGPSAPVNPSAAEKQTPAREDAPGSGEPRDDAYNEGQAVAVAAALLKSDFEKRKELNSEQVSGLSLEI
jgi:hypothetical protein